MTNFNFNGHSNPQDQKIIYEFGKEMRFDKRQKGRKSARDKSRINLPNSLAAMDSEISTINLPEDPNELCDGIK